MGHARARTIWTGLGVLLVVALVALAAWQLAGGGDDTPAVPAASEPESAHDASAQDASTQDAPDEDASPVGAVDAGGELRLDSDVDPATLAPAPTSRDLVEAARHAGELDQPTAVAYRVLAQFHDPALPEAYRGAAGGHDVAALAAVGDHLDELPDDLRERVASYLRRPTDPDSAFAGPGRGPAAGAGPRTGQAVRTVAAGGAGPAGRLAAAAQGDTCGDWVSAPAADGLPLRVWTCDPEALDGPLEGLLGPDTDVADRVRAMLADVPGGLGPPVPDDPDEGGHPDTDDRIDLYLLEQGSLAPERDGEQVSLDDADGPSSGLTVPTAPMDGSSISGYILVDSALLDDPSAFTRTVVHEFFHVQQYAHNVDAGVVHEWFAEASATWAETHFVRPDSAAVHDAYLTGIQSSPRSLRSDTPDAHPYQAYVWPLFMEQRGGASTIFRAWSQFAGMSEAELADGVIEVLDGLVPLGDGLPDFAMRLFNAAPAGDPIPTRFVHLDGNFPDDRMPPLPALDRGHVLDDDPVTIDYAAWDGPVVDGAPPAPAGVPGLGYRYDHVTVPGAGDEDDPVSVEVNPDETLQAHQGTAVLEALVRDPEGEYRRERIDLERGAEFCGSEVLVLVLTNTSHDDTELVDGAVTIERDDAPICAVTGDIVLDFAGQHVGSPNEIPFTENATIQWRGALEVETGALEDETDRYAVDPDEVVYSYYPDAGSTWQVVGSYRHERCAPGHPDQCHFWTEQVFEYDGEVAAGGGDLRIIMEDDEIRLEADVPVDVTTTLHDGAADRTETRTEQDRWSLRCHADADADSTWWGFPQDYVWGWPGGSDVAGAWVDDEHTTIAFDCQHTWEPRNYGPDSGETGTTSFSLHGEVELTLP